MKYFKYLLTGIGIVLAANLIYFNIQGLPSLEYIWGLVSLSAIQALLVVLLINLPFFTYKEMLEAWGDWLWFLLYPCLALLMGYLLLSGISLAQIFIFILRGDI